MRDPDRTIDKILCMGAVLFVFVLLTFTLKNVISIDTKLDRIEKILNSPPVEKSQKSIAPPSTN